jgi:hypothetical protein
MLPQKFSAATTKNFPLVPLEPPDGGPDALADGPLAAAALDANPVTLDDEPELPYALSATASRRVGTSTRSNRRSIT